MAERSLTVLQLLPALESGGVERGTLEVANALVAAGHIDNLKLDGLTDDRRPVFFVPHPEGVLVGTTDRYGHGVLGDGLEATGWAITGAAGSTGAACG